MVIGNIICNIIELYYSLPFLDMKLYVCEDGCELGATIPATVVLTGPTYYDVTFAKGLTGSEFKMLRTNDASSKYTQLCEVELYEGILIGVPLEYPRAARQFKRLEMNSLMFAQPSLS